jgi:hypothetical protein
LPSVKSPLVKSTEAILRSSTAGKRQSKMIAYFLEGVGVAIEGTAKGFVDAGEMLYKAAMSRPSRFVGRSLVKGLVKLDEKLMEEPSKGK